MKIMRVLNKIIYINIAATDYAEMELNGNICFIGVNNLGKTTMLRAILFFYNANPQRLGIGVSQQPFERYYFPNENSYLIYEVADIEDGITKGAFHIIVYRKSSIYFRFVDAPYDKKYYIQDNTILELTEILKNFSDEKPNIDFSNQIETFKKYRNIIYGIELDKQLRKYAFLRGEKDKYNNIHKAISSIFLNSSTSITSDFVKSFIISALNNQINSQEIKIDLTIIQRQLDKYSRKYKDIKDFLELMGYDKNGTQQEGNDKTKLIIDNFDDLKELKKEEKQLAGSLGGGYKFAKQQFAELSPKYEKQELLLKEEAKKFNEGKKIFEGNKNSLIEKIGKWKGKIEDATTKKQEYKKADIEVILEEWSQKQQIKEDLKNTENDYKTLTTDFDSIEQQFKVRFDNLDNTKQKYLNGIQGKSLVLDKKLSEDKVEVERSYAEELVALEKRFNKEVSTLNTEIQKNEFKLKDIKRQVKAIEEKEYFTKEINETKDKLRKVEKEIEDCSAKKKKKESEIKEVKNKWETEKEELENNQKEFVENSRLKIQEKRTHIKDIEEKLNISSDALYGFLEENYPNWKENVGKVCKEDVLFRSDLNPKLIQEIQKSLYGIAVELSNISFTAKDLEDYENEKENAQQEIEKLQQSIDELNTKTINEKGVLSQKYNKQIRAFEKERKDSSAKLKKYEQEEKGLKLALKEHEQKAKEQQKEDLEAKELEKSETLGLIKDFKNQLKNKENKKKHEEEQLKQQKEKSLAKLQKDYNTEQEEINEKKQEKLDEFESEKIEIQEEKNEILLNKGVNTEILNKKELKITNLKNRLNTIEGYTDIVSSYNRDKEEFFDKIDDFQKKIKELNQEKQNLHNKFQSKKTEYEKLKSTLDGKLKSIKEDMRKFQTEIRAFSNFSKSNSFYVTHIQRIENAPSLKQELTIQQIISKINANFRAYSEQFSQFQKYIDEVSGKLDKDNHFNLILNNGDNKYFNFARQIIKVCDSNTVEISMGELARTQNIILKNILGRLKELKRQRPRVEKKVSALRKGFKRAEFGEAKLVESIEVKTEDTQNPIIEHLEAMANYYHNNIDIFSNQNTLFNYQKKRQDSSSKQIYKLLSKLQRLIKESSKDSITLEDSFKLLFKLKEGRNTIDWTEKIGIIGSTGTNVLVKTIINITLLGIFIKEAVRKNSNQYKIHCILDEVGQISNVYLKKLIHFAESEGIYLINGLPNESKLEMEYNYTYAFRKASNNIKIDLRLTSFIEV